MSPEAAHTLQQLAGSPGSTELAGNLRLMGLLTVMTMLPTMLILMTSFTRIIIVLSFVRTALGTPTIPPTALLIALALILTSISMGPTVDQSWKNGVDPFLAHKLELAPAVTAALAPFREFMFHHVRDKDLGLFLDAGAVGPVKTRDDIPTRVVISAFATSELKSAFETGFTIFLAFLIIDLVVASILMSMGMMMVPPMTISLPLKILVFVLADGWYVVIHSLLAAYH